MPARTSSMPSFCATARAVRSLSPVAMMIVSPLARRRSSASAAFPLTGSATAMMPATVPSTATNIDGLALGAQRIGAGGEGRVIDAGRSHHRLVAECGRVAEDRAGDALAGDRQEVRHRLRLGAARFRAGDDRLGQRMLRARLEAQRQHQYVVVVEVLGRHDVGQHRPALGQRAGLVDDQRVDVGQPLERLRVADQHAGLRAAPGRGHDRHRRREPERAGTGDDQHRNRRDDGIDHPRARVRTAPRRRRRRRRQAARPARNRARRGRRGSGSARGCAARWRPSRRCATAPCRRRPFRRG